MNITKRIHKFTIASYLDDDKINDFGHVKMPVSAKIISVQIQDKRHIVAWAEVLLHDRTEIERKFYIIGTGFDLHPQRGEYLATVQIDWLVLHVYGDYKDLSPSTKR